MKSLVFILLIAIHSIVFATEKKEAVLLTLINNKEITTFTASDLIRLPQHSIKTANRWSDNKKITFTGVKLLPLLGDTETIKSLYSMASNGYIISIPIDKIKYYDPIIAHSANGVRLTTKTKGPLWLMFPYDDYLELQTNIADAWYIWHLKSIEIKK